MSRVTLVYVAMVGAFAIGLWAIVTSGTILLHAPTDLAGRWQFQQADQAAAAGKPARMLIEQSGRFFRVDIDGRVASLKLQSERISEEGVAEIRLSGQGLDLVLLGSADADEFHLEAQGTLSGSWTATRVQRAYPKRRSTRPASHPA